MNTQQHNKITIGVLIGVMVFQALCLTWEFMNGGVVTHHFLMRKDLPGVSNWWGLVILPVLVLCTSYSIKKRAANHAGGQSKFYRNLCIAFSAMLLVSVAQSTVFSLGYHEVAMFVLLGLILAALVFPLHRLECVLGYVLGSTFFTGPAMPFVGVVIFSVVSILVHLCIKPLISKGIRSRKEALPR